MSKEICSLSRFHFLSDFLHLFLRALVVSLSHGEQLGLDFFTFKGAMLSRIVAHVELNNEMSSSVFISGGEASIIQVLGAAVRASEKMVAVWELM